MSGFFVTTNGHSASKWVAARLNEHPDLTCTHGPAPLPLSMQFHAEYSGADMATILASEPVRKSMGLDAILDEIDAAHPAPHVGNVHHFNLWQLDASRRTQPPERRVVVVDLVRHPLHFVRSSTANIGLQATQNAERFAYLRSVRERNLTIYEEFEERHGLDGNDIPTLAFMAACMTMISFERNFAVEHIEDRVRMEDVTREPQAFRALVETLTDGQVPVSDAYLEGVFAAAPTNTHQRSKVRDHAAVYAGLAGWQRELFGRMLDETGVEAEFLRLGYDLSFRAA